MKIWYQMGGTYRYGEFYADFAARLEARVSEIVRPDTEVYITGLPKMDDSLSQAYALGLTKTDIDGIPVLDSVACVLKAAEAMVDLQKLGVKVSRKVGVYKRVDPELRQRIIDTYKEGHKIVLPE